MSLQRLLAPVVTLAVIVAVLLGRPLMASASACDSVRLFTLHTAQKNAWDSKDFTRLYEYNLEEAKYTDECAHKDTGPDRIKELRLSAVHYNDAAFMELGRKNFDLAKRHYQRSNEIIAEILREGAGDMKEELVHRKMNNDDGIRRADKHKSTAA